jgi:hypothetical protein
MLTLHWFVAAAISVALCMLAVFAPLFFSQLTLGF